MAAPSTRHIEPLLPLGVPATERSAALAATGAVTASGTITHVFSRSAALAATAGIASVAAARTPPLGGRQRDRLDRQQRELLLDPDPHGRGLGYRRYRHRSPRDSRALRGRLRHGLDRHVRDLLLDPRPLDGARRDRLHRHLGPDRGRRSRLTSRSAALAATGAIASAGAITHVHQRSSALSATGGSSPLRASPASPTSGAPLSTRPPASPRPASSRHRHPRPSGPLRSRRVAALSVSGLVLEPPPLGYIDFPGIGLITRPLGGSYAGSMSAASLAQTRRGALT